MSVNAILLILIMTSLSSGVPHCHIPPPPPDQIPTLSDCHDVLQEISTIATLEDNDPVLWSRFPPAGVGSRKIPFPFADPRPSNDCEFVVDALYKGERYEDTFSTAQVALAAKGILETCLQEGVEGEKTIGAQIVGPKRIIVVLLLKKSSVIRGVGGLHVMNGTNGTVELVHLTSEPGTLVQKTDA